MSRDYRLGLIVGSILAGFALLWVATRPGLTPRPQPRPSVTSPVPSLPIAAGRAGPMDRRTASEARQPTGDAPRLPVPERRPVAGRDSSVAQARDANAPVKPARVHTVRPGETLSAIAQQYYGSSIAWRKILAANKSLKDANRIAPGTKLVLPD